MIATAHRLIIAIALLWLATPMVSAADKDGAFALKGIGRLNCAQFVDAAKNGTNRLYQFGGWLEGYVSAYNHLSPDTFDVLSFESPDLLARMIGSHCSNNPDDRFADVVVALVGKLKDERIAVRSKLLQLPGEQGNTYLYAETLRRTQQALKERDYYEGTVDGAFGPATRAALQNFQRDNSLIVTGAPDQQTLRRLLH